MDATGKETAPVCMDLMMDDDLWSHCQSEMTVRWTVMEERTASYCEIYTILRIKVSPVSKFDKWHAVIRNQGSTLVISTGIR